MDRKGNVDYVRSFPETATILKCSVKTLRRMNSHGNGPRQVRVTERIIGFRDSDINAFRNRALSAARPNECAAITRTPRLATTGLGRNFNSGKLNLPLIAEIFRNSKLSLSALTGGPHHDRPTSAIAKPPGERSLLLRVRQHPLHSNDQPFQRRAPGRNLYRPHAA